MDEVPFQIKGKYNPTPKSSIPKSSYGRPNIIATSPPPQKLIYSHRARVYNQLRIFCSLLPADNNQETASSVAAFLVAALSASEMDWNQDPREQPRFSYRSGRLPNIEKTTFWISGDGNYRRFEDLSSASHRWILVRGDECTCVVTIDEVSVNFLRALACGSSGDFCVGEARYPVPQSSLDLDYFAPFAKMSVLTHEVLNLSVLTHEAFSSEVRKAMQYLRERLTGLDKLDLADTVQTAVKAMKHLEPTMEASQLKVYVVGRNMAYAAFLRWNDVEVLFE